MEASLDGGIVDSRACGASERHLIKPQSMVSDLDLLVQEIVFKRTFIRVVDLFIHHIIDQHLAALIHKPPFNWAMLNNGIHHTHLKSYPKKIHLINLSPDNSCQSGGVGWGAPRPYHWFWS